MRRTRFPALCVSYIIVSGLRAITSSFDWFADFLCPLWLARMIGLILVLLRYWLHKNQSGKRYPSDLYFRRSHQKIHLQQERYKDTMLHNLSQPDKIEKLQRDNNKP